MATTLHSRIAPTPSGYLHIGNAYNFLLTEAITRKATGSMRLRIDDLDAPRIRPEFIQDIFDSLQWLGIHPHEGPVNVQEHEDVYAQRLRFTNYNLALSQLRANGHLFACDCSRKDLQQNSDGQYPGTCIHKGLSLDSPNFSWRIVTPIHSSLVSFQDHISPAQDINLWDTQRHFIVRRRDGLPAYQLASLIDDVSYGINTIFRGLDLLSSTAAQLYLAGILGLNTFLEADFYHHPLLVNEQGDKLSKSAGSTSLKSMRESGISSGQLRQEAENWYKTLLS